MGVMMNKPMKYEIGQVVPVPADFNPELAKSAQARRGSLKRSAKKGLNQTQKAAAKILAGLAENERLRTDPIERAKTHLRRKGFTPVYEDRKNLFVVGRHKIEGRRAFTAFAKSKGFEG